MKYLFLLSFLGLNSHAQIKDSDDYRVMAKAIETKIIKATTYSDRAKINREGSLSKNTSGWVKLGPYPKSLDKDSIKVRASKGFRIDRLLIEENFERVSIDEKVQNQLDKLKELYAEKIELTQEQKLKNQKRNFLSGLYFSPGIAKDKENYVTLTSSSKLLTSAFDVLLTASNESIKELQTVQNKLNDLNKEINLLKKQLNSKIYSQDQKWVTYVYVSLSNRKNQSGKVNVEYLIPNAQWKPSYDLRARIDYRKGIANIDLVSSGIIKQNTSENWEDIEITLSTLDPFPLVLPVLNRFVLQEQRVEKKTRGSGGGGFFGGLAQKAKMANFDSANESMMMDEVANAPTLAAEGLSSSRAQTSKRQNKEAARLDKKRADKNSKMDRFEAREMEEDMVEESSSIASNSSGLFPLNSIENIYRDLRSLNTSIENIRNAELQSRSYDRRADTPINFNQRRLNDYSLPAVIARGRKIELKSPFTISVKSDDKPLKIPLKSQSLKGNLSYLLIPKKDKRAFIKAQVHNKLKSMILAGPAQIYMDGDLVSKTDLPTVSENTFFNIDLGIDENVESQRIVSKKSREEGTLRKRLITQVDIEIQIVNNNNFSIKIDLRDNYPLSSNEDLEIKFLEASDQTSLNENGLVFWNLDLKSKEKRKVSFSYEVSHPKNYLVSEFN